jgi:hypothetical protein
MHALDDVATALDAVRLHGAHLDRSCALANTEIAALEATYGAELPGWARAMLERWGGLHVEAPEPPWPHAAPVDRLWPTWLDRYRVVCVGANAFAAHPVLARLDARRRHHIVPLFWREHDGPVVAMRGAEGVTVEIDGDDIQVELVDADPRAELAAALHELANGVSLLTMSYDQLIARCLDVDLASDSEDCAIDALCVRPAEAELYAAFPALLEKYGEDYYPLCWLVELAAVAPVNAWGPIRAALERLCNGTEKLRDLALATLVHREPSDPAHHDRLRALLSVPFRELRPDNVYHLVVPIRLVASVPADVASSLHVELARLALHPLEIGGEAMRVLAKARSPELDHVLPRLLEHITDAGFERMVRELACCGVATPRARRALLAGYKELSPTSPFQLTCIEHLIALNIVDKVMLRMLRKSTLPRAAELRERVTALLPPAKKKPTRTTEKKPTRTSAPGTSRARRKKRTRT